MSSLLRLGETGRDAGDVLLVRGGNGHKAWSRSSRDLAWSLLEVSAEVRVGITDRRGDGLWKAIYSHRRTIASEEYHRAVNKPKGEK
jgi:hypothetical protein